MTDTETRSAATTQAERNELRRQVNGRPWYHTLELAPGIETPGWFDCRGLAPRVLPGACAGMRCLDIGTFDGFWAFEIERRRADEVIAIDILDESRWDWPHDSDPADRGIEIQKGAATGS